MSRWTRRDVVKLGAMSPAATALRGFAQQPAERNLALNRAAWSSGAADFMNTAHMATDGQPRTRWRSVDSGASGQDAAPWIYVDLGALCMVRAVRMVWGTNVPTQVVIETSAARGPSPATGFVEQWIEAARATGDRSGQRIELPATRARYVRLRCEGRAKPGWIELFALEVYGSGGVEPAAELPDRLEDGTLSLTSGWKLVHQDYVREDVATISRFGYDTSAWLRATVPGTVLTSYLNAGAVPDMFYGDHQLQVSDFFAHSKWMYRKEMIVPQELRGRRVWLNFAGVHYRAYVYANGTYVGRVDGAFVRGAFDVTQHIANGRLCIVVLIMPVPSPDVVNVKGLTNYRYPKEYPKGEPIILPAASWDWLPTIRDRDIGLWNHVQLKSTGDVTIHGVFASTHFPDPEDTRHADITLKLELRNHAAQKRTGLLQMHFGDLKFEREVSLDPGEVKPLTLTPEAHSELAIVNPKLWWPNGYGAQNLYPLVIDFVCAGTLSDRHRSRVGIREFTYNHAPLESWELDAIANGGPLTTRVPDPLCVRCNGQRIFLRGVNWGIDEGMLRCDRGGFETRLRMERAMNFNIIRNWAGNLDKSEFFDLCDEYGLLVWEEFGLCNEVTPDDPGLWLDNARDRFLRRRNHACIVLWCSANESMPKDPILTAMPAMARELDGTRLFLQSSIQVPPTDGDGPYTTHPPSFYFRELAAGFRTELGSPAVPCVESMKCMMPEEKLWPINDLWGMHDWLLGTGWGGSGMCGPTQVAIDAYGTATGIEDFCRKAQMVSMEVGKAIYESWNDRIWDDCTGVMLWMSNPGWPSLTWNTYDYTMEPTAAYFAFRNACEPVHVQWNCLTHAVKVVNTTLSPLRKARVEATIYRLDGSVSARKTAEVDSAANAASECLSLRSELELAADDLSAVHFIALKLEAGDVRSENFYWRAKTEWAYGELEHMPRGQVAASVDQGKSGRLLITLRNQSAAIALMVRVKLVDVATGRLVAPVLYSDNYMSLVPGNTRLIEIELPDHVGESTVWMEGWNMAPAEIGRVHGTRL